MDFEFSEEQRLLKDSVERLLSDRYDFEQRKAYMQEPGGFGRALWKRYADLGLLGLPFDEAHGGSGGGPVETMIVAEAFGRALALEPYVATVVLAGGLLRHTGSQTQRDAILPKVAEGSMLLAFAHAERQGRRRGLRHRRTNEPRAQRRCRRQADRVRARLGQPA